MADLGALVLDLGVLERDWASML